MKIVRGRIVPTREKTADVCPAQLSATVGKLLGIDPPATCEEPALVDALK